MSDKTYAETQGEAPFDWWKALENPEQYNHTKLRMLAVSWVTCACGNKCAIIPRRSNGAPLDAQLWALGDRFASAISHSRWDEARELLGNIEARSQILIAVELAKLNAGAKA